jgi:hypothetical protein
MTDADRMRIETDKIEAVIAAPDGVDTLAAIRQYSAAQLRFIAKAFERMEEGFMHADAEHADKR